MRTSFSRRYPIWQAIGPWRSTCVTVMTRLAKEMPSSEAIAVNAPAWSKRTGRDAYSVFSVRCSVAPAAASGVRAASGIPRDAAFARLKRLNPTEMNHERHEDHIGAVNK